MNQKDIEKYKKEGRWPLKNIPDVYFLGSNYWYTEKNFKRIDNSLKEAFNLSKGKSLLDISFGNPIVLKRAYLLTECCMGHYIDKSFALKDGLNENILSEGDYYNLPFPNNNFDVITSYAFLHIIPDINTYFQEVYRLLKHGGCLYTDGDRNIYLLKIIRFINMAKIKAFTKNEEKYLYWKNLFNPKNNFHKEGISYKDIRKMLLKIGFKKAQVYPWFTSNPKYKSSLPLKIFVYFIGFFHLNFLFTHIKIIATK